MPRILPQLLQLLQGQAAQLWAVVMHTGAPSRASSGNGPRGGVRRRRVVVHGRRGVGRGGGSSRCERQGCGLPGSVPSGAAAPGTGREGEGGRAWQAALPTPRLPGRGMRGCRERGAEGLGPLEQRADPGAGGALRRPAREWCTPHTEAEREPRVAKRRSRRAQWHDRRREGRRRKRRRRQARVESPRPRSSRGGSSGPTRGCEGWGYRCSPRQAAQRGQRARLPQQPRNGCRALLPYGRSQSGRRRQRRGRRRGPEHAGHHHGGAARRGRGAHGQHNLHGRSRLLARHHRQRHGRRRGPEHAGHPHGGAARRGRRAH
mmetsp:Transcript_135384/g.432916  ORF Transcript_135384/g.432916 Transcript_135384/m.432916 type:complete len:318 (-) Transcript_135384:606-1559(-)